MPRSAFLLFLALSTPAFAADVTRDFKLPPDFEVTLYAGDDLAHDIHAMTFDSKGRVVVAGPGYVKVLHDTNNDGRADSATLFSSVPKSGAHGLYFDGNDLICTGDNAVMRLADANGDGKADDETKPEVWAKLKHSEHGSNGVIKGPDGWYYIACGNDSGVTKDFVNSFESPVTDPNAGAIVRISPDGKKREVFAHGFRNIYDLAFNEDGQLFTYDSDGERDHHLPWYTPTRIFHVAQGKHHGWLQSGFQRSWSRPDYFPDSMERLAELGRGSPTGVEVYRHTAFHPRYHGGLFALCWTFGRVYFLPLNERHGATYKSSPEIFMEPRGSDGFAPVDLAVSPAGDLFIAIGGRSTRGSVYRVRYIGRQPEPATVVAYGSKEIETVVNAPQPLSSWSRAKWIAAAKLVGRDGLEKAIRNTGLTTEQRMRAVEACTELHGSISIDTARLVVFDDFDWGEKPRGSEVTRSDKCPPSLAARVAWAMVRRPYDMLNDIEVKSATRHFNHATFIAARLTFDNHPDAALAGWDQSAVLPKGFRGSGALDWRALGASDRRVRAAALAIAEEPDQILPRTFGIDWSSSRGSDASKQRLHLSLGWMDWHPGSRAYSKDFYPEQLLRIMEDHARSDESIAIEAIRLMQIGAGDIRIDGDDLGAGYTAKSDRLRAWSIDANLVLRASRNFPWESRDLNREFARLCAMTNVSNPFMMTLIASMCTVHSRPDDDLHYLLCLCQMPPGNAIARGNIAGAFLRLHAKMRMRVWAPSRNWPLRVAEAYEKLATLDPKLPGELLRHPLFGEPEHCLFVLRMKGEDRTAAALLLLGRAMAQGKGAQWTPEMAELIATLPAELSLPVLRKRWDQPALRDAIIKVLAKQPSEEDRDRFRGALRSSQPEAVMLAASALMTLRKEGTPEELISVFAALREATSDAKLKQQRESLTALLRTWTKQTIVIEDAGKGDVRKAYQPWFDWFAKAHPAAAMKLNESEAKDWAQWKERLAKIDWSKGEAVSGKLIFEARGCHLCHAAATRLGPDLAGVARFSREDLLAAIVDPNRDVAPLYRTRKITTTTGDVHVGILIYDSPEAVLIQTGPTTTVRVTQFEMESNVAGTSSLMPGSLLNGASDKEIADLDAFLRELKR